MLQVFRGVPYAAPPVGPYRFKAPQPPLSWPGTRLADSFGPVCPQNYPNITNRTEALLEMPKGRYSYLKKLLPLLKNQAENCLFLNIYVPGSGRSSFCRVCRSNRFNVIFTGPIISIFICFVLQHTMRSEARLDFVTLIYYINLDDDYIIRNTIQP